ncbi:hypothetical protein PybrP1_001655 [[Pythium] brassicae (nom. inval.)]|nr:hypothetical protein PybrP1_001655 [[Pythium] brassicae (nom. inval.)]
MEGLTLKNWKLGEKLGAGACSDVFAATPVRPTSAGAARFVVKVSQVPALSAAASKNKKRKKTPAERNADALYAEYLVYQSCLRDHARAPRLPDGAYGEDKGYRFLVLERLGRTLETVLREEGVYCLDFGISDRYVMATGKHKDFKTGPIVGTPTFVSLNCHTGATPSRRDDVEALLHVLIYLQLGSLPWQNASSDAEGAKLKKATSAEQLCRALPTEWRLMLAQIRGCGFEAKPEYAFFVEQFTKLGGTLGSTEPFNWGDKAKKPALKLTVADPDARKSSDDAAATPSASPANKRTKKESAPLQSAVSKQAPAAKARKVAPAATAKKARKKVESDDEDDDDSEDDEPKVVMEVALAPDSRRRRKDLAARRAVAAHAAATAAVKLAESASTRTLRSSSRSSA